MPAFSKAGTGRVRQDRKLLTGLGKFLCGGHGVGRFLRGRATDLFSQRHQRRSGLNHVL